SGAGPRGHHDRGRGEGRRRRRSGGPCGQGRAGRVRKIPRPRSALMKLTFNVFENHRRDADRHWPGYVFGGRVRTSTLVLIIAFFATWWTYDTYRPHPAPPAVPQVVPPGYVPDPNYTWVPRTRV